MWRDGLSLSGLSSLYCSASAFCGGLCWLLNPASGGLGFCFEMGKFPPLVALKEGVEGTCPAAGELWEAGRHLRRIPCDRGGDDDTCHPFLKDKLEHWGS